MPESAIALRGVHVNNLKHVDLDIPHGQLVVLCGVSGSGKTSLALDTLYAEGQRRYIESFSAYTRQFLEQLQKPAATSITGIPPAIAVTHKSRSTSNRATVGTATEIVDYLRLMFARIGQISCPKCGRRIQRDSAESIAERLEGLAEGERYMVAFPYSFEHEEGEEGAGKNAESAKGAKALEDASSLQQAAEQLREDGFVRWIVGGTTLTTDQAVPAEVAAIHLNDPAREALVVVDRLAAGRSPLPRIRESLETAASKGNGQCTVFVAAKDASKVAVIGEVMLPGQAEAETPIVSIDGKEWLRFGFNNRLVCGTCGLDFPRLEPRLFSFNSPLGACDTCEGSGETVAPDMQLVVPSPKKTIADGAIEPWNAAAYSEYKRDLLQAAAIHGVPVDVPFSDLSPEHIDFIRNGTPNGTPDSDFKGLDAFFVELSQNKPSAKTRKLLDRYRSLLICPDCDGTRLKDTATSVKIDNRSIADLCRLRIGEAQQAFDALKLSDHQQTVAKMLLDQVTARLRYLKLVGLGYLSLDRALNTLSCGEAQRVALTSALASDLVNMLYVLDEPSVGLHPHDLPPLLSAMERLKDRGNTVVVIEHEENVILTADHVVEVGPAAGEDGGEVTFAGSPAAMCEPDASTTGEYVAGRRGLVAPEQRREPDQGWIRLRGARGNNLQNIDVDFPLGTLCLVTGVSGAGKSTLVQQTLYPALCRKKKKKAPLPHPFDSVSGETRIEDILLVDQNPIGRSARSNPVTYIKAFDAIRNVFANTAAAKTRNYTPGHFSFNVDGGRCDACKGDGTVAIDMQFLADVVKVCRECDGKRYRREVLEILYRGKSISDVLSMTVREATTFFRGQDKVQSRLEPLDEVGLGYLRLGQAANTLSAGEAQRLKLAGFLATPRRGRTLFLLDEPTTGLHFSDIVRLNSCFDALIELGHTLIVVEHNVQLMKAADYIIDLGPGAADEGGTVVATGTPEEIAKVKASPTGRVLAEALQR